MSVEFLNTTIINHYHPWIIIKSFHFIVEEPLGDTFVNSIQHFYAINIKLT